MRMCCVANAAKLLEGFASFGRMELPLCTGGGDSEEYEKEVSLFCALMILRGPKEA